MGFSWAGDFLVLGWSFLFVLFVFEPEELEIIPSISHVDIIFAKF